MLNYTGSFLSLVGNGYTRAGVNPVRFFIALIVAH